MIFYSVNILKKSITTKLQLYFLDNYGIITVTITETLAETKEEIALIV